MIRVDNGGVKETLTNTFANWLCNDASPGSVFANETYTWGLFSAHQPPL